MGTIEESEPAHFCRLARVEVFDGNYQVLLDRRFSVHDIDTTDTHHLDSIAILYAGLAREIENEPMSKPRVVLYCTHTGETIADHLLVVSGR